MQILEIVGYRRLNEYVFEMLRKQSEHIHWRLGHKRAPILHRPLIRGWGLNTADLRGKIK